MNTSLHRRRTPVIKCLLFLRGKLNDQNQTEFDWQDVWWLQIWGEGGIWPSPLLALSVSYYYYAGIGRSFEKPDRMFFYKESWTRSDKIWLTEPVDYSRCLGGLQIKNQTTAELNDIYISLILHIRLVKELYFFNYQKSRNCGQQIEIYLLLILCIRVANV